MKLGPVTKIDKRNKATSKKLEITNVMSKSCDVIAIFSIYGKFETIWKTDSGRIVYKT